LVPKYPDVKFVCVDKVDYCASVKNMDTVMQLPNFKFVKADICSSDIINYLLVSEKIDTVMHFAAQSHVDNSFGNSFQFTMSNVYGTHVLLEASKSIGSQLRRFIHVSTDEVYGESTIEHGDEWFSETSALKPTNPYAATKAAAELMVSAYQTSFKMPCIITRGNNVFGSHQYPEKLIPKFINLLERNRPLCLHGDGSHRRSFIYVEDVARAFDTVLHKGIIGEIYNIGTEFEVSNLDVSRALLREYGLADKESEVRAARVLVVGCSVHSFLSFTSHSASPSFVIATSTTVATTSTTAS
jgi:UDP-glucose 4,6-dehydratase